MEAFSFPFGMSSLLERAVSIVFGGRPKSILRQIAEAYTVNLAKGVIDGYGKQLFDVAWDSPDAEKLRFLQSNVFQFSHAKSYQQFQALSQSLVQDGKVIPFDEFKALALRINNEYAVRYLRAEYETAIASSQMASKWVQFQKDKDILPNLTYRTMEDDRVRPSHAELDDVTRPVDDPFWDEYYPPNGWGCRCDVIQSTGGRRITPSNQIPLPDDVPPMFKVNMAKAGIVFPDNSPYYDHLPANFLKEANNRNPFEYEKLSINDGAKGWLYNAVISHARPHELEMAKDLANAGKKVIMLPEINADTDVQRALRKLVLPDSMPEGKNIDALIDDILVELKNTTGNINTVISRIEDAAEQSENICIKTKGINRDTLIKRLTDRQNNPTKDRLLFNRLWWLNDEGNLEEFDAKDFD